ncbi:hypothetical protein [Desnuesiella massiliensis]|uniref:hypothetical protein n=1 Tax=Desnuesiella massiliensis TaxID=1650662 RepID=UPI0006E2430B|nr:hypothetical protein [Desnuesiella massiliensis]
MLINTQPKKKNQKLSIAIDLGLIFIFLPLSLPLFILFGNYINANSNFISVVLLSIIEFCAAGLGAFVVMFIRKESFSDYGIKKDNIKKSILFTLSFIVIMILLKSIDAGGLVYFPMRTHTTVLYSLNLSFPFNLIGIMLTFLTWGIIEGFYYVVIIKKIDDLLPKTLNPWFSLAPIVFYLYNFIIHYSIRTFIEGRAYEFSLIGTLTSLLLAYAMTMPRKLTNNSWGSLIYQTLQNGIGKL